jgi:hypothetical protein
MTMRNQAVPLATVLLMGCGSSGDTKSNGVAGAAAPDGAAPSGGTGAGGGAGAGAADAGSGSPGSGGSGMGGGGGAPGAGGAPGTGGMLGTGGVDCARISGIMQPRRARCSRRRGVTRIGGGDHFGGEHAG